VLADLCEVGRNFLEANYRAKPKASEPVWFEFLAHALADLSGQLVYRIDAWRVQSDESAMNVEILFLPDCPISLNFWLRANQQFRRDVKLHFYSPHEKGNRAAAKTAGRQRTRKPPLRLTDLFGS
jgi:hypothetical protein